MFGKMKREPERDTISPPCLFPSAKWMLIESTEKTNGLRDGGNKEVFAGSAAAFPPVFPPINLVK